MIWTPVEICVVLQIVLTAQYKSQQITSSRKGPAQVAYPISKERNECEDK
jgi:hypothetical protein